MWNSNWPIIAVLIICLTALLLFVVPFIALSTGMCRNEILFEVYSPDQERKAVVFQRDCGATTDYSTQLSIIEADYQLKNNAGNVFIIDDNYNQAPNGRGGGPRIDVIWTDSLIVKHHPEARIFLQETKIGNQAIYYKTEDVE